MATRARMTGAGPASLPHLASRPAVAPEAEEGVGILARQALLSNLRQVVEANQGGIAALFVGEDPGLAR